MKNFESVFGNSSVRSSASIEKSLLRRAFARGRGEEMQQKISAIKERVNAMPKGHETGLKIAQLFDEKCGTSQTLRKLSLRSGYVHEDMTLQKRDMAGQFFIIAPPSCRPD